MSTNQATRETTSKRPNGKTILKINCYEDMRIEDYRQGKQAVCDACNDWLYVRNSKWCATTLYRWIRKHAMSECRG